jgi:hypothetical protein
MPAFSLWAWHSPLLGTMDEVLTRIEAVEMSFPSFAAKINKAVWRGNPAYNPISNTRLRPNLLSVSRNREWADIEEISYGNTKKSGTALKIEDHCRYKYIIYTEGITYSGRLPYHQACASVLITPPITHHTYSSAHIRPLFSSTLDLDPASFSKPSSETKIRPKVSDRLQRSWPHSYLPSEANTIFVNPDWSDLEAVIQWLHDHEDLAESIAERQRDDLVNKGYLSQAAEACYWRALIRGWASVAEVENQEAQWDSNETIRFEEYVVRGHLDKSL